VSAPRRPRALITDFGGVLSTPLLHGFAAFQDHAGVPLEALGRAIATLTARDGANPVHELELGRMTEPEFLRRVGAALEADLGHPVAMHEFTERYWAALGVEQTMVDLVRDARAAGFATALLTNNVREWEPRWRAMLPVDELFDVVVDSAFVGLRKPDPAIYRLTCERLGVAPEACVFVDDLAANVAAAAALGMIAVHFREAGQSAAETRDALAGGTVGSPGSG
jgi:epoxide hydrolase-like predicted phosphatase